MRRRLPPGAPRRGGLGEMFVSPTGCGKTSTATRFIRYVLDSDHRKCSNPARAAMDVGFRVLVLCDLDRLVGQMFDDLDAEGCAPIVEKAEKKARWAFCANNSRHARCVLASAATLKGERLRSWPKDSFDLIVIDEAHCFFWLDIVEWFDAPYLGMTATPMRQDGRSMREWFHHPYIRTLTLREAIEGWTGDVNTQGNRTYGDPFLSRIRLHTVPAHHIDLSAIRLVGKDAKDLNPEEADAVIYSHTKWLASAILAETEGRRPWIYTPKIRTAEALAEAMRDMGARAAAYHSNLDDPTAVLNAYRDGKLDVLTNVNMLIKGVNVPAVDAIVRLRPTVNIPQATQEIGRGTRNSPQTGKRDCLIVEFDFQTGKRKLSSVLDAILDGSDDVEQEVSPAQAAFRQRVRAKAEAILKQGQTDDVLEANSRAEKQARAELDREKAERAQKAAQADEERARYERVQTNHATEKYDPFCGLQKAAQAHDSSAPRRRATPEQMARLEELTKGLIKTGQIDHWTEEMAAAKIREQENRKTWKMATDKQVKSLVENFGWDQRRARNLKTWEASTNINLGAQEYAQKLSVAGVGEYEELVEWPVWKLAQAIRREFGNV